MRILLLRLEGPLQSWGENSKWDDRDSAPMPTKSGIVGLIACCMGIHREDARLLWLHTALQVSVRSDRPGELGVDFQTVKPRRLMTAEGAFRAETKSTIVSRRQYLQDAAFLAAVTSTEDMLLEQAARALRHPVWPPYLGRKCCVPTAPIFLTDTQTYESVEEAFRQYPPLVREDTVPPVMLPAEFEDGAGERTRMDQLQDTASHRFFSRAVRYENCQMEVTEHVPFSISN